MPLNPGATLGPYAASAQVGESRASNPIERRYT